MQDHSVFITWKPDYNLGIPIIDEQHRGVVSIINSLYYGMQNCNTKDVLEPVIDMLHVYTRLHFRMEEDFFNKSGFPNAKEHITLHKALIDKLDEVGRKSMLDNDPYKLMDFLKKWWIHHICEEDISYRDFIIECND